MKYTDYYASLGVSKDASEQDIRRAYRRLAKDYHPDTHPGDKVAEQKFKAINEAYEVLGDKQKRARYDQLGANWNQYQNMEDMFGGFGQRPSSGARGGPIFDLNFSDFFETFFGEQAHSFWDHQGMRPESGNSGFRQANKQTAPQNEIEYSAEITLEEALNGTKRRIQIQESVLKTIEVKIPAGVKDGSKIRVASEGGHLYLVVHLKAHPIFTPDGNSLRCIVSIADYDALLGTTRTVPTLNGNVQMKIPAGSQAGQTFRIRGQGLPDLRNPEQRGDILAALAIQTSTQLSDEEHALITRFRELRQGRNL